MTTYRKPLDSELHKLSAQLSARDDWNEVKKFVDAAFPPGVAKVVMSATSESDDEGGSLWSIEDFAAYDARGGPVSADFSLPFWAEMDHEDPQPDEDDMHQMVMDAIAEGNMPYPDGSEETFDLTTPPHLDELIDRIYIAEEENHDNLPQA